MAYRVQGQLDGLGPVLAALNRLPKAVHDRVMGPAVKKAVVPLEQAARARAQQDSGLLRRSIGAVFYRSETGLVVGGDLGPRSGFSGMVPRGGRKPRKADPRYYAHLVELGTRPHSVARGSSLKRGVQKPGRMHPGARPKPFLRPAWASARGQAATILAREIGKGVEREAKKLGAARGAA